MPTLAVVVAQLVAVPRPVLCLDTCDILEVIQCLDWEKPGVPRAVKCIEPVQHLLDILDQNPTRIQIIVTDLVATEWTQNISSIRTKAEQFLSKIDEIVGRTYQAAALCGIALPAHSVLAASTLVRDLEILSTALLDSAIRLDLENSQISLAVQRVMNRQRPSQDGHIKDSINFEHYLHLARQLRSGGFTEECVFVSKNRKDFWEGDNPSIHNTLLPEIADPSVGIKFFGSIEAALGFLHI